MSSSGHGLCGVDSDGVVLVVSTIGSEGVVTGLDIISGVFGFVIAGFFNGSGNGSVEIVSREDSLQIENNVGD